MDDTNTANISLPNTDKELRNFRFSLLAGQAVQIEVGLDRVFA